MYSMHFNNEEKHVKIDLCDERRPPCMWILRKFDCTGEYGVGDECILCVCVRYARDLD